MTPCIYLFRVIVVWAVFIVESYI